jgi:CPA2 family monovalent cation:H+ antiporter-2
MAMGAFVAGVMLAESSYRHELEADIEPFRGILLGLFFVAVGLAVNLEIVWNNLQWILIIVPTAMLIKGVVIYGLCRVFDTNHNDSIRVAFVLPQHGEFAFVLFSAAVGVALLTPQESSFLIACVTLSMALTPLSVKLGALLVRHDDDEQMEEDFEGAGSGVMMIGFSRLGQIAAQTLLAGGCEVTVLDNSAERIRQAQRFGFRIYFGDGTRHDVLRAAGIEKAEIIAICTHSQEITNKIVELVSREYPKAKLYVRSYDRGHSLDLLQRPGLWEIRETFESALVLGHALLEGIGIPPDEAKEIVADVRRRDADRLKMQLTDGGLAGRENLHSAPVPEPLVQPRHQGQAISSETEEILED